MDQRTAWQQRIHAVLYHHGLPERGWLLTEQGRAWLARLELPPSPAEPPTWPCGRSTSWTPSSTSWTPPWPTSPAASRAARPSWAAMGSAGPAAVSDVGRVRRRAPFANSRQAVRFTGQGHHRCRLRHQMRPWPPRPPRPTGGALGVARGGQVRRPPRLAQPRLLPAGPNPAGASGPPSWSPAPSPVRPTPPSAPSATRRWRRLCSNPPPDPPITRRPGSIIS
jgi:hypothetical protein